MSKQINVALIGNPNTGKTSVFNNLTGLKQKVGNYPGITVEKKEAVINLTTNLKAHIIDLPGTYSLNATSLDENVVIELLLNKKDKDYPDVIVVVSDIENLKRNLLLFTQVKDLGIPTVLAINMADQMERKGIQLDVELLEKHLKTKINLISARKNQGFEALKQSIIDYGKLSIEPCLEASVIDEEYFNALEKAYPDQDIYKLWLKISQDVNLGKTNKNRISSESEVKPKTDSEIKRLQQKETIKRYQFINNALKDCLTKDLALAKGFRAKIDRLLIHKVWGYVIFLAILFLIFQTIYDWSTYPMDFIDYSFMQLSALAKDAFPPGMLTDLIAEGIIPGIGGIVIFVPQIAFLFLFISILEETGYMSRVVFLMDRIMRNFGMSGKSVVPLVSGTACAIPAIMAARNIESWKERLVTILVVPFTTCSARLPVYLIIISLVIPDENWLGLFNYQAMTLMLLYLIGFGTAVISGWLASKMLKVDFKSYFVVEMPNYQIPIFKNVAYTVVEKTKSFVFGAGKIILAISIILWVLASYGPNEKFDKAEEIVMSSTEAPNWTAEEAETNIASFKLKHSFIGYAGRAIEPAVAPLGYDWKIGIALISSFAAREVFVGTLATIYSVGSDDEQTIKSRMAAETNPILGGPLFSFASGISLLLFYAFAMQCMSTLAIVKKETGTWKWPMIQLFGMSGFAYIVALIAFQILK